MNGSNLVVERMFTPVKHGMLMEVGKGAAFHE